MITWTQISPNAPNPQKWDQRATYGFGANVYFKNKIWVMGGQSVTANLVNDVWSSVNGVNWTLETNNPGWGPRLIEPVVFNNKLWVIGGSGNGFLYGDVWSSSDGINWTQVLVNAPWGHRGLTNPIVFNNKLWILGGWNDPLGPITVSNDIWSSPDGITWTQVNVNAPWAPRAAHSSVVFNGKIWVMGGRDFSLTYLNDIWSSPDGINWTQATGNASWSPRFGHTSLVFNGKIYVLGGNDSTIGIKNDVWSSLDGMTWTQVTSSAPWAARYFHQTVVTPLSFGLGDLIPTALQWRKSPTGTPNNNPIPVNTTPYPQIYFVATISNPSSVPVTIPANSKITISTSFGSFGLIIAQTTMGTATTIAPGGTQQINLTSVTSPNIRASANTYTLKLTIDQNNVVSESDETNNTITQNLIVQ